jgi:putative ABC transport system permease protein
VSALIDDIRFGARTFRKHPGFTVGIVFTLAAGVGAATIVFAVVNAALYSRYDVYRQPNRLVVVWEQNARLGTVGPASIRNVADWRTGTHAFERLGTYQPRTFTLTGEGEPDAVNGGAVSDDMLALLDARPALGRLFTEADRAGGAAGEPGAPRVALLSHALWQRRFGGSAGIVGRVVMLNGHPATIVGVLAAGFTLAPFSGLESDVVVPAADPLVASRSARNAIAVGRLRPGATTVQARNELKAVAARLEKLDQPANAGWDVLALNPMEFDFNGDAQFLVVLAVGVGFVLMIVCANVTNLLLARAATLTREIATRLALGAGRLRVARQFLTESLMLGTGGSAAGVFLAYWGCRAVSWSVSGTAVGWMNLTIDARVLTATATVSMGCALFVGLLPAFRLSRTSLMAGLKEGAGAWPSLSGGRLRTLLVSVEIALAVVLLSAAGLVLQGVANLRHVDPGVRPEGVMSLRLILPDGRYHSKVARAAFADDLIDRLAKHPGVASVAVASHLPAIGGEAPVSPFTAERPAPLNGRTPAASIISASGGYFDALRVRIKAGRAFTAADRPGSQPVAIVSEGLVKRWMAVGSPVGSRLLLDGQWRTVVGVAADVRNFHVNVAPAPAVYVPYSQRPVATAAVIVRAANGNALALAPAAQSAIRAIDRDLPLHRARSMTATMEESLGGFDLTRLLVGALAGSALILAAMGLYAVVSYSVARRTREFGVRLALGAGAWRLQRQVVAEGLRRSVCGGVPGLVLAAMMGRLLASKLHGVSAVDPVLFAGVAGLVMSVVMIASWVPARRASRVDPVEATRAE